MINIALINHLSVIYRWLVLFYFTFFPHLALTGGTLENITASSCPHRERCGVHRVGWWSSGAPRHHMVLYWLFFFFVSVGDLHKQLPRREKRRRPNVLFLLDCGARDDLRARRISSFWAKLRFSFFVFADRGALVSNRAVVVSPWRRRAACEGPALSHDRPPH